MALIALNVFVPKYCLRENKPHCNVVHLIRCGWSVHCRTAIGAYCACLEQSRAWLWMMSNPAWPDAPGRYPCLMYCQAAVNGCMQKSLSQRKLRLQKEDSFCDARMRCLETLRKRCDGLCVAKESTRTLAKSIRELRTQFAAISECREQLG